VIKKKQLNISIRIGNCPFFSRRKNAYLALNCPVLPRCFLCSVSSTHRHHPKIFHQSQGTLIYPYGKKEREYPRREVKILASYQFVNKLNEGEDSKSKRKDEKYFRVE
jgi:hypothetical protein